MSDTITNFLIDRAGVRGRVVRLGTVADTILGRYPYPEAVAHLLGEVVLVAAMLSANLKQEGIVTLQLRGNGPVGLLVADAAHGGQLRGYAEIGDPSAFHGIGALAGPRPLVGDDATLAITLDPGPGMQRYQGVVALEGDTFAESVLGYFTQSQQIDVALTLAVARGTKAIGDTHWRAGGLMIERLPAQTHQGNGPPPILPLSGGGTKKASHLEGGRLEGGLPSHSEDGWAYARAILGTLKDEELLDPTLEPPELLYRLFHEQGVWVYEPHQINATCRCSRERMLELLRSMPPAEKFDMLKDGEVKVHCRFCNTTQRFGAKDLGVAG